MWRGLEQFPLSKFKTPLFSFDDEALRNDQQGQAIINSVLSRMNVLLSKMVLKLASQKWWPSEILRQCD